MAGTLRTETPHSWPNYSLKTALAANLSLYSRHLGGRTLVKSGIFGQFMSVSSANLFLLLHGQHMAYRAKHKRKSEVIIVDWEEGPEFEEASRPIFSPDGQRIHGCGGRRLGGIMNRIRRSEMEIPDKVEALGERRSNMKRGFLLTLWTAICACELLLSCNVQQPSARKTGAATSHWTIGIYISTKTYSEKMIDAPVVKASSKGWNADAMHHVDAHQIGGNQWIAAVDAFGK